MRSYAMISQYLSQKGHNKLMKELHQDIFAGKDKTIDWAGVDYDGELNFGKAVNPRYTWASERWRGYKQIGESVENSGYKPLTQIRRVF